MRQFDLRSSRPGDGLPEGFCELAARIYNDDPMWTPEDESRLEATFSNDNPWFQIGEAELFCIPDAVRAVVFLGTTTVVEGRQAAFYGYYESAGVEGADAHLFEELSSWARNRGADYLLGPINFSTYGMNRVRTRIADDGMPFHGEPYNPLRYADTLMSVGLERVSPAVSQRSPNEIMRKLWQGYTAVIERIESQGFRFASMTPEIWLGDLPGMHRLINEMFGDNYAYSPLPYELFARMCDESFVGRMDPNVSQVVYGPNDDIVGFQLLFPHYGPLMTQSAGEDRVPAHELNYKDHFPLLKKYGKLGGIHKTLAVHPDYREAGVFRAMGCKTLEAADGIYDDHYAVLIREDNPSRKFAHGVAEDVRWYSLYGRDL